MTIIDTENGIQVTGTVYLNNSDITTNGIGVNATNKGNYYARPKIYVTNSNINSGNDGINLSDGTCKLTFNSGTITSDTRAIYNSSGSVYQPNLMHLPAYLTATMVPEAISPGRAGTMSVTLNSTQLNDYGLTQASVYLAANPGDKATKDNLIGVSTVLLPAFTKMSDTQKMYAPKMFLSKEEVNIVFDGKSKRKEEIQISNIGRTPLNISSLQMFTDGLEISLGKSTLQAGESTKLKIMAQRDRLLKARTRPRILMITNDPDKSKVVITINAK